jgi:hypothetical protein
MELKTRFAPASGFAPSNEFGVLPFWRYLAGGRCILDVLAIPLFFRIRYLGCWGRLGWAMVVLVFVAGTLAALSILWSMNALFVFRLDRHPGYQVDFVHIDRRQRFGRMEGFRSDTFHLFDKAAGFLAVCREAAFPCKTKKVFFAARPGRFNRVKASMHVSVRLRHPTPTPGRAGCTRTLAPC